MQKIGMTADGKSRDERSYYRRDTAPSGNLTFDISNNRILASLNGQGIVKNAAIVTGLEPTAQDAGTLRGVPVRKRLVDGGPWCIGIWLEGRDEIVWPGSAESSAGLLGGFSPLFSTRGPGLAIRLLAFAPIGASPEDTPAAVIQVVELANEGSEPLVGHVKITGKSERLADGAGALPDSAREAVICLDGEWSPAFPKRAFRLAPGERAVMAFGFLLGEHPAELAAAAQLLRRQDALAWFNQTGQFHAGRLGRLSIPDDPFWPEFLVRASELCRQPAMYMADGRLGGTFIASAFTGPSVWTKNVWIKDSFYQMLPMAMFDPKLCADSILFFLERGMPRHAYGRGVKRFSGAAPETHSLSLALAPFLLSGEYFRMTGDRAFFKAHPEIVEEARKRFRTILASRREGDPFLFPSMYISDGDARGDFHTGSNVLLWHSFLNMARIAREACDDQTAAREWQAAADKIKAAIRQRCIGESPEGPRYFEGANRDGTYVPEIDGEESDVGLMPFYGFTEADDPALQLHARLGLTERNPLFAQGVEGVWWHDEQWFGTTFPGWTTALAGAADEAQLKARLDRIASLTDLDGSIWWWPYNHGETHPQNVRRVPMKSAWAAGVFLCRFVNDIVGFRVDVPEKRFSLRPFHPWKSVVWERCRLGAATFDLEHQQSDGKVFARVVNRNPETYSGQVELVLPPGAKVAECRINGSRTRKFESTQRYGRAAVRIDIRLRPGQVLNLEILHRL